jgi:hypothetical protein
MTQEHVTRLYKENLAKFNSRDAWHATFDALYRRMTPYRAALMVNAAVDVVRIEEQHRRTRVTGTD